jgi:hypothetical protein
MSEKLSRWEEKKVRKWVRRILSEDTEGKKVVLTEDWDDFWGPSVDSNDFMKTFVTPFTDVLKVAQVATKDLLSVAALNLELLFNFKSPEKAEEALNRYNSRRTKIDSEYKEVMKTTEEALGGADTKIVMMALNPGGVLAAALPSAVRDTAGFLKDAGFDKLAGEILPKTALQKGGEGRTTGPIKGALDDLAKIFFFSHHEVSGEVLSEVGKEAGEEKPAGDAVEIINAHFEEIGLSSTLKKMASDVFSAKEEQIKDLIPVIKSQGGVIKALADANTLEEFKQAATASGGAVEDLGEIEKLVKTEAQKMLKDPVAREDMVKKFAEKEGLKPEKDPKTGKEKLPEVADDKLLPELETVVFTQSKENLQKQLEEGQTKLKEDAIKEINDDELSDVDLKMLDETPDGKKYADMLRDAVRQVNEA